MPHVKTILIFSWMVAGTQALRANLLNPPSCDESCLAVYTGSILNLSEADRHQLSWDYKCTLEKCKTCENCHAERRKEIEMASLMTNGYPCGVLEALIDPQHKTVYVDNCKAGSSTMRKFYKHVLKKPLPMKCTGSLIKNCSPCLDIVKTTCIEQLRDWEWFTIVRNPIAKFESGVHEAKSQKKALRHLSADELLERQIERDLVFNRSTYWANWWLDKHLQPSSCRVLDAYDKRGRKVDLNYTIQLEDPSTFPTHSTYFRMMKDYYSRIHLHSSTKVAKHLKQDSQTSSVDFELIEDHRLSPSGVKMFMQSRLYGQDHELFHYPNPTVL